MRVDAFVAREGIVEAGYAVQLYGALGIVVARLGKRGDVEQIVEGGCDVLKFGVADAHYASIGSYTHAVFGRNPVAYTNSPCWSRLHIATSEEIEASAKVKKQVVEGLLVLIVFSHTRTLQHIVERAAFYLCRSR